jgi:MFS family permease
MSTQRWTLAVVSAATAMLMLDIAVVNTALSSIAEDLDTALAVYGATITGSFAVGPLVGGALTSGLAWRWIFLVNVPIGLFCQWVTLRRSRSPVTRPRAGSTGRVS